MIEVTKLNDVKIIINADLIETIEATPDAVITLINGKKFVVKENVDEVMVKAIVYQQKISGGIVVSD
ncbi:MAG: flagellar FlbD family protein [Peptococcia bacterium]